MDCLRSSVMVTPEMTISVSPFLSAGKRLSQGWCLNSTLNPPAFAIAFIKSTSKPSTLPAESNDSKGANSALAATRYTLSALGADEEASLLWPPQAESASAEQARAAAIHFFMFMGRFLLYGY